MAERINNNEWRFKLPEVKVRLSKMQKWIMENCDSEEGLTNGGVYNRYYPDNKEIEENIIRYREYKMHKERNRLKAKLKNRWSSIRMAFNQVYLQKLVQEHVTYGIPSEW